MDAFSKVDQDEDQRKATQSSDLELNEVNPRIQESDNGKTSLLTDGNPTEETHQQSHTENSAEQTLPKSEGNESNSSDIIERI